MKVRSLRSRSLFAGELITGLARIDGQAVGIIANQSKVKGGVLFRGFGGQSSPFYQPYAMLLIFRFVFGGRPGFMVGTQVERAGIIRHGAKMISRRFGGDRAQNLDHCPESIWRRIVCHGGRL